MPGNASVFAPSLRHAGKRGWLAGDPYSGRRQASRNRAKSRKAMILDAGLLDSALRAVAGVSDRAAYVPTAKRQRFPEFPAIVRRVRGYEPGDTLACPRRKDEG